MSHSWFLSYWNSQNRDCFTWQMSFRLTPTIIIWTQFHTKEKSYHWYPQNYNMQSKMETTKILSISNNWNWYQIHIHLIKSTNIIYWLVLLWQCPGIKFPIIYRPKYENYPCLFQCKNTGNIISIKLLELCTWLELTPLLVTFTQFWVKHVKKNHIK